MRSDWFTGRNLVGADVVGVSPQYDLSGNAALVGVTLMYDFSARWRKPLSPRYSTSTL